MPHMPSDKRSRAASSRAANYVRDNIAQGSFELLRTYPDPHNPHTICVVFNDDEDSNHMHPVHLDEVYLDPPEPVGTLDDALGVVGQLQDELEAIGPLENPLVRAHYDGACRYTKAVQRNLEAAIAADNEAHPEDQ